MASILRKIGRALWPSTGAAPDSPSSRWRRLAKFLRADSAATAVEYAVVLAFILMAVIAAIAAVGDKTNAMWGKVDSEMKAHGM
ncbi:MAG: Flp family type IVb pilin [Planctomycetes bacterium]|nr:Flp family type IVb pilin [Planctomycetota bacterium]